MSIGTSSRPDPRLSLLRIFEMNIGFFGLQFSFGLQQANMGPIYAYLGASEAMIPLLWLAGPVTGLVVQPLVGAMSDRTLSPLGRRTPYFLVGAVLCSLALLLMPHSSALWMAAGLLWMLDAGNNVTMEPYRAYVADRLAPDQRTVGFLTQSAFTGLAHTLSYLAPSLFAALVDRHLLGANGVPEIVRLAFVVGAVLSISSILYSMTRVPELPLTPGQRAAIAAAPLTWRGTLGEIRSAIAEMPRPMRQLALAMACQWYAMMVYWQYIAFALSRSLYGTSDASSDAFRDAALTAQRLGAVHNTVAFAAALLLIPVVRRLGARSVHAGCLAASGLAMTAIPSTASLPLLVALMAGIGLGWAGMMGNTYVMLADSIPPARNGIYMGIFNLFIVIPMLFENLTLPLLYRSVLGGDARNALVLAGILMLAGALATLFVDAGRRPDRNSTAN
ncbi:MFS transporter [Novosphingobium sp. BL-52-GroH]|uniref:MFS transporter n=1 Tax=Novosphingobium sp. BL-52-GroH TaxID=3349877 RepID=UPI003851505B